MLSAKECRTSVTNDHVRAASSATRSKGSTTLIFDPQAPTRSRRPGWPASAPEAGFPPSIAPQDEWQPEQSHRAAGWHSTRTYQLRFPACASVYSVSASWQIRRRIPAKRLGEAQRYRQCRVSSIFLPRAPVQRPVQQRKSDHDDYAEKENVRVDVM